MNELNQEEVNTIVNKVTENPFSNKYNNFFGDGIYLCKRCNAKLFNSEDKLKPSSGWPAFDDEIKGAIKRIPDKDGIRTEALCANCEAHLGHIFEGEDLTEKNVRYCINSISLNFNKEN